MARQHYQRLSPADIDEIWMRMRAGHSVKPTRVELGAADQHGADLPDPVRRDQT